MARASDLPRGPRTVIHASPRPGAWHPSANVLAPEQLRGSVDPDRVRQALENLLANALQHGLGGEGDLDGYARRGRGEGTAALISLNGLRAGPAARAVAALVRALQDGWPPHGPGPGPIPGPPRRHRPWRHAAGPVHARARGVFHTRPAPWRWGPGGRLFLPSALNTCGAWRPDRRGVPKGAPPLARQPILAHPRGDLALFHDADVERRRQPF
jgi:hypothetical protein